MNKNIIYQINRYFKDKNEVIAVYLFGSYAKDKEQVKSDIDLAILLDADEMSRHKDLKNRYYINLAGILRKDLHILIMNNIGEDILAQILKYGRCIVKNNPEILSQFTMVKHAMIADYSYYKDIMIKGFLKKYSGENDDR